MCTDGYTGESCEIDPSTVETCSTCRTGYSCLPSSGNELPCWPDALVLDGRLPTGAWDDHFHQGFLGVYHRVTQPCQARNGGATVDPGFPMPVYRKDGSYSGPDGTKHPAFISAQGLPSSEGSGWWNVGVNWQPETQEFLDDMDCLQISSMFATGGWQQQTDNGGTAASAVNAMFEGTIYECTNEMMAKAWGPGSICTSQDIWLHMHVSGLVQAPIFDDGNWEETHNLRLVPYQLSKLLAPEL